MNTEKKDLAVGKLYARYQRLQIISLLAIVGIIGLIVGLCWYITSLQIPPSEYIDEEDVMASSVINFMTLSLLVAAVSFVAFIFSSIFKHSLLMANFWYSRAVALDLYESESNIPLKDVVAALASDGIKLTMSGKSIAELMPVLPKTKEEKLDA